MNPAVVLRSAERAVCGGVELDQARALEPFQQDHPSRTYAVVGIEGIAPYWFHLSGQLFLSDKGDLTARIEAELRTRLMPAAVMAEMAAGGDDADA